MNFYFAISIQGILGGIFMIAAGVWILLNRYRVTNMFPRDNIFERKLGAGSTYPVVAVGALMLCILGFTSIFGLGDNFLLFITSPIRKLLGGS